MTRNELIDRVAALPVHKRHAHTHRMVVRRAVARVEAGHAIEMLDEILDRTIARKIEAARKAK